MRYFKTNLFEKITSKLFRVYVNEKGEEGIFVTLRGRRVFIKTSPALRQPNPSRVAFWMKEVERLGGPLATEEAEGYHTLFGINKIVHPAFAKLWRDWKNEKEKEWYQELVLRWHSERDVAREELWKLVREGGPGFWEEVRALNEALLKSESEQPLVSLYRGVVTRKIPKDYRIKEATITSAPLRVQATVKKTSKGFVLRLSSKRPTPRSEAPFIIRDFDFASYSSSIDVARRFGHVGTITIPTSRVVAHWRVGFGSTPEREYIVHAPYRYLTEPLFAWNADAFVLIPHEIPTPPPGIDPELRKAFVSVLRQARFYSSPKNVVEASRLAHRIGETWLLASVVGSSDTHFIHILSHGSRPATREGSPAAIWKVTVTAVPNQLFPKWQQAIERLAERLNQLDPTEDLIWRITMNSGCFDKARYVQSFTISEMGGRAAKNAFRPTRISTRGVETYHLALFYIEP